VKYLSVGAAGLAVFLLLLVTLMSAPAPAPATNSGFDRCRMCHPTAHPDGWTMKLHAREIQSGQVAEAECQRCHSAQDCTQCHAAYRSMLQGQQSGSGAQP
jgi:hypothetical protein